MGYFLEKAVHVRNGLSHSSIPRTACAFVFGLVLWVLGAGASRAQESLISDGIAAVVNDKVITYVQINQTASEAEKSLRDSYSGTELLERVREAKLQSARALIERELILQDFNKNGGSIPETYTNEQINDIIRKEYSGDRVAFIKTYYERGITMQRLREEINDTAIVGYMRSKNVSQTVLVSPFQIEKFYQDNLRLFQQNEQVKISTIVLRKALFPSTRVDTDGKQITFDPQLELAREIVYKLDTGSDFADLAKAYSEAPNKDDGGELGWVTETGKQAIRSDLWPAVTKLQPGQHSDVLTTSDGFYYILQVEDQKKAEVTPIEDVRAQIERTIVQQQSEVRQRAWIDSLRSKAFIKMFM